MSACPANSRMKWPHLLMRLNSPDACIACHDSWLVACTATGTAVASVTGVSSGSESVMLWPWAARILAGVCCSSSTNRCCMHRTHGIVEVQQKAAGSIDRKMTAKNVQVGGMCCSSSTNRCCKHQGFSRHQALGLVAFCRTSAGAHDKRTAAG